MIMETRKLKQLVLGLWLLNMVVAVSITSIWLIKNAEPIRYVFSPPAQTASYTPSLTVIDTPTQTFTIRPVNTPTPSETPTPSSSPTITNTSIPFSEGPIVIGYSVEERPLEIYRFGNGPTERLIVAGMHGGSEFNTIQLAEEMITYIAVHPEIIPEDVTLYILRSLNPDGEARARDYFGRANANNVDLNRNWDANWQKDWPRENCWTYTYVTAGTAPGSEPETQALMTFIIGHKISAILNYHSAALGIFPGGLPPDESTLRLAEEVAAVTIYAYPPINVGCIYTGGFVDWADEHGIPALDIELSNHTDTDFEMNLLVLDVLLKWKP
jgi:3D (Asp-Asp-Asp) domain-containing protein